MHNRVELTAGLLDHLRRTDAGAEFDVIVSDDGSTEDASVLAERHGGGIRLCRSPQNLGFAAACNRGAALADGDYLLFLNNDTAPAPGWLGELVSAARSGRIGAAVPKLIYPDGTIQCAGMEFNRMLRPGFPMRGLDGDAPEACTARELPIASAACVLMPRHLFLGLRGFDERFRMYYEDIDLFLRVWKAGWKVIYWPRSEVVHQEHASLPQTPEELDACYRSFDLFADKWSLPGDFSPHRMLDRRLRPQLERWRAERRKIAVYGAGMHTAWLLSRLGDRRDMVAAIIDDVKGGREMAGLPVVAPGEVRSLGIGAIVVSSDAFQEQIMARAAGLSGPDIELFPFYPEDAGVG
jgi:GT2 family glycosyltransferase